jgi:hypothetical protein
MCRINKTNNDKVRSRCFLQLLQYLAAKTGDISGPAAAAVAAVRAALDQRPRVSVKAFRSTVEKAVIDLAEDAEVCSGYVTLVAVPFQMLMLS